MRTATPSDLGKIVESEIIDLRGTYEDAALVLGSEGEPSSYLGYLAQALAKQIRARGYSFSPESPLMIPLSGLSLVKNSNSPYGLIFSLIDGAELIEAPQLAHQNYYRFSIADEKGRPIADEKGNRISFTRGSGRNSGVSRFNQSGFLNLHSSSDDLCDSATSGRVVIVSSEAGAQNLASTCRN